MCLATGIEMLHPCEWIKITLGQASMSGRQGKPYAAANSDSSKYRRYTNETVL